jgi:hypothetical protein
MVRWVGHALYRPELRRLVWSHYTATEPRWSSWSVLPDAPPHPHSTERGYTIHTLPWGTPHLADAWGAVQSNPAMTPFKHLPDKGRAFVSSINYEFLSNESIPNRGTVDLAIAYKDTWVGVEIKTGLWRYGPTWEPQIQRHLREFPYVLLTLVTEPAACGKTPSLVLCSV